MIRPIAPNSPTASQFLLPRAQSESPLSLCLEIRRGHTRFPQRPIGVSRFLIGSGEECDLRLGGEDMPSVHSVIRSDGTETRLERLASVPPLTVNGQEERDVRLEDGDLIRIGEFEFSVQFSVAAGVADDEVPLAGASADEFCEEVDDIDCRELSAAELVELIEQEQALAEEFDAARAAGADALLTELQRRSTMHDVNTEAEVVSITTPAWPQDDHAGRSEAEILTALEGMLQQLTDVAEKLQQRSQQISRREADYVEAAEQLLDAQQQLALRFESLLGRISDDREPPQRAIA